MFGPLKTYLRQPWEEKSLIHELAFELARARWAIAREPFRDIAARLGEKGHATNEVALPKQKAFFFRLIRWLRVLSARLPWESACLVQALAVERILRRRGLPTTLYLGVARDEIKGESHVKAHAWLRCGDRVLTGGRGASAYTQIECFGHDATCRGKVQ